MLWPQSEDAIRAASKGQRPAAKRTVPSASGAIAGGSTTAGRARGCGCASDVPNHPRNVHRRSPPSATVTSPHIAFLTEEAFSPTGGAWRKPVRRRRPPVLRSRSPIVFPRLRKLTPLPLSACPSHLFRTHGRRLPVHMFAADYFNIFSLPGPQKAPAADRRGQTSGR